MVAIAAVWLSRVSMSVHFSGFVDIAAIRK